MKIENVFKQCDVTYTITFNKNKLKSIHFECEGELNNYSKYLLELFEKGGKTLAEDLIYDIEFEYRKKLKKRKEINMFIGDKQCFVINFYKGQCSVYWSNSFKSNSDMFDDFNVEGEFLLNTKKVINILTNLYLIY